MPPEARDPAYVADMLAFARETVDVIEGLQRSDLDRDLRALRALERTLNMVGEAARRVSNGTRARYPEVRWSDIVGMRNILAHEYGRIDVDQLWRMARHDASRLISDLEAILADLGSDG